MEKVTPTEKKDEYYLEDKDYLLIVLIKTLQDLTNAIKKLSSALIK